MDIDADLNVYRYAGGNPLTYTDPFGLISQSEADRMERCELARPRVKPGSPVQFWAWYGGHLIKWIGYQNRLRKLLKAYDDKNCHDDISGARDYVDKPYPDFNWDEWRRRLHENMDDSFRALTPDHPIFAGPPSRWIWEEFLR
jgi:hypothetical protein